MIKDVKIGEDEFKIGSELNETIIEKFIENNIFSLELAYTNSINKGTYLLQTLFNNKNKDDLTTKNNSKLNRFGHSLRKLDGSCH